MSYHNVNHQQQQQQGIVEPYSAFQNYHQQLPGYGGNVAVLQQQPQDAQGSVMLAVTEGPAQMIHRPVYAQQQPLLMPSTKNTRTRPTQSGHKPQKKRPRNNPRNTTTVALETTTSQSTDPPTTPVVDRIPFGKERRRTQMRMAQRAYRQRKQNELSSRAKQLSERDDVIVRMKAAFDLLNARLVDANVSSICPGLDLPMREMERGFEALAQMAGETAPSASVPVPAPVLESGVVVDPNHQRQWTSPRFDSDSSDPFDPLNQPSYQAYHTTAPAQTFDLHQQYPNSFQYAGNNAGRTIPVTTTVNVNEIALPTPSYISPPTSYSFQETTFARRLMRICMERAHDVLINGGLATLSPKEARVFKLAYRIWSHDYLVQKFQMAITGTINLFDPSVPFLPLGGAGTHFLQFRESPPPSMSTTSSSSASSSSNYSQHQHQPQHHLSTGQIVTSGPLTTHTAHIRHEGPDTSLTGIVSSLGLLDDGSEWFDVQDIDGYLQDMGIRLEPHSTTYRFSVPANPGIASRRTMMNQNPLGPSGNNTMAGQEYVPAYVDVERFINSLVTKAMCLGRVPGFRKQDVEEQFYNSIEVLPS